MSPPIPAGRLGRRGRWRLGVGLGFGVGDGASQALEFGGAQIGFDHRKQLALLEAHMSGQLGAQLPKRVEGDASSGHIQGGGAELTVLPAKAGATSASTDPSNSQ